MVSWPQFAAAAPRLASQVQTLLEQYGQGLGYLATVRADGGPRVHPVAPVITDQGLFCFIVPSPKRNDLERDGRYALHSFPPEDTNEEAYLAGTAVPVTDRQRISQLAGRFQAAPHVNWRLFELTIEVAMVGRAGPVYHIWRDDPREPGGRRSVRTMRMTLDVRTNRPHPPGEQP